MRHRIPDPVEQAGILLAKRQSREHSYLAPAAKSHRGQAKSKTELTMGEVGSSTQLLLQRTGRIMFKINGAKTAFTFVSTALCAVHRLVERSFSIRLVLSALLLGAIAATLTAWLSDHVLSLIRATMKPRPMTTTQQTSAASTDVCAGPMQ